MRSSPSEAAAPAAMVAQSGPRRAPHIAPLGEDPPGDAYRQALEAEGRFDDARKQADEMRSEVEKMKKARKAVDAAAAATQKSGASGKD